VAAGAVTALAMASVTRCLLSPRRGRQPGAVMRAQELRNLYHEFRDLDALAFAGWEFEAAYHALAGAMHCADRLRDGDLLAEVQQLAQEQGQWIDTHAPDHRLALPNGTKVGHRNIFTVAANETDGMPAPFDM